MGYELVGICLFALLANTNASFVEGSKSGISAINVTAADFPSTASASRDVVRHARDFGKTGEGIPGNALIAFEPWVCTFCGPL